MVICGSLCFLWLFVVLCGCLWFLLVVSGSCLVFNVFVVFGGLRWFLMVYGNSCGFLVVLRGFLRFLVIVDGSL